MNKNISTEYHVSEQYFNINTNAIHIYTVFYNILSSSLFSAAALDSA